MDFELAYDLALEPGNEVVFVKSDNRHRKVRVFITQVASSDDAFTFSGNSLGSSVKQIKAAKKDEPPVLVSGSFEQVDGVWRGLVQPG